MRDTDGDGVVDCKDKQLITPTECQPVDADGVGKCPDPACCKGMPLNGGWRWRWWCWWCKCQLPVWLPKPQLKGKYNYGSIRQSCKVLATIAAKMKTRPDCKIVIKGYPETSKSSQAVCQKAWCHQDDTDRKEGISADRITTNIVVAGGDKNKVDISSN